MNASKHLDRDGRRGDPAHFVGADEFVAKGPPSSRALVLNSLSALTFVVLLAVQIWWWRHHGRPLSWVLLVGTPLLAFVPSGVILKLARTRWTEQWAATHGFVHHRRVDWQLPQWDFPPFSIGRARRRRIGDAMTGVIADYPARFFHYRWVNNNRVQLTTHYRNVFVLRLPAALPRLTIGITTDLGVGDRITFESEDFNNRFSVHSHDPTFAHAVLTPRLMDDLLTLSRTGGTVMLTKFEIVDDELVAITTLGNRPEQISQVFVALWVIARNIDDFVWQRWGTRADGEWGRR